MKTTYMLETGQQIGKRVVDRLAPYCRPRPGGYYIEVAGSVRRRRTWVHDVDIVLVPGDSAGLYREILAINHPYTPKPNGPKIKGLKVSGIPIDLYIADEKEWATLLLIRTGSAQNNIRLCARAKDMGWHLHADGSGLFNEKEERIAGDTELSIFNALGLKYQEPWERG